MHLIRYYTRFFSNTNFRGDSLYFSSLQERLFNHNQLFQQL